MLAEFIHDLHPCRQGPLVKGVKVNFVVILAFSPAGKSCSLTAAVNLKRTLCSVSIYPSLPLGLIVLARPFLVKDRKYLDVGFTSNLIAGSLQWAYIEGGCDGGVWAWHLGYAPFPRSHMCYYSQISILVTNLTIHSERQVLTDGYRLVLPDR